MSFDACFLIRRTVPFFFHIFYLVQFRVSLVARIVGAPKVATGLSEAREAAGAIAEPRIACFLRSKKPPKE